MYALKDTFKRIGNIGNAFKHLYNSIQTLFYVSKIEKETNLKTKSNIY